MKSNHRRCQIIIDKHPDDYGAAMGELRVRCFKLGERIKNGISGKERTLCLEEYNEIRILLDEWSKMIVPIKKQTP